jgi:sporulation protein YlmC with PRC-barrel domain
MKKFLIPAMALCVGGSLLLCSVGADEKGYKTTTTVVTPSALDFKDHMNVSQLLHSKVVDQSGQKIGELEDIVLDPNSGRIQFGVLKLSGDLADSGKYAPVPFSLFKLSDMSTKTDVFGHHDLTLQADRDKLLSASKFNIKTWPDRDHIVMWGPDVYSHYGVTVDSNIPRGSSSTTIETDTGAGSSVIVREHPPRTTYYYEYEYIKDAPRPIDNGTAPDGKDTFRFWPRPWPYNQFPAGQQQ